MKITLILALDESRCLGKDGTLAWHNGEDLKHFKEATSWHVIVMGRKTFDSIWRPLPNRRNMVISRTLTNIEWLSAPAGVEYFDSIESCLAAFENQDVNRIFVIWGAEIYRQFLEKDLADELWISHIPGTHEGDVYFPYYENRFDAFEEKRFETFDFVKYRRINSRISIQKWTSQKNPPAPKPSKTRS